MLDIYLQVMHVEGARFVATRREFWTKSMASNVSLSGTKSFAEFAPNGDLTLRGTASADRVADVLSAFVSGPASLGVSEIARQLQLSKAVVFRILQSLVAREFLQSDPATHSYRLGPSAAALGARALRDMDMRSAARPVLEALRDRTNETTTLTEIVGDSRVYLDQFESRQSIRMLVELGQPHALHAGSSGKSILAFLPRARQAQLLDLGLAKLTDATITNVDELVQELRTTAERGYAVSLGERQSDAGSVAAPVFGNDGVVIGAVSVCGPVGRFDAQAIAAHSKLVVQAGADVSRRMGWTGLYPNNPDREDVTRT